MENIRSFISGVLPTLTDEQLANVIERLQEFGVEDVADMEFLRETDMASCLKLVQIRKLLRAVSITQKAEPAPSTSEPVQQHAAAESRRSSVSSYASAGESIGVDSLELETDLITQAAVPAGDDLLTTSEVEDSNVDAVSKMVRAAVGRIAQIGDLYDARSDCFTGQSLFPPGYQSPEKITQKQNSKITFRVPDTLAERFDMLGVQDELRLSMALGLAHAEGSSDTFIRGCTSNTDSIRGCLVRTIETLVEELDDRFYLDLADGSAALLTPEHQSDMTVSPFSSAANATHVVVGISWGLRVLIIIERSSSFTVMRKIVEQDLEHTLSMLAKADQQTLNEPLLENVDDNYATTSYADFQHPSNENRTFYGALTLLQKLPDLASKLTTENKGSQLAYKLFPLSSFQQYRESSTTSSSSCYNYHELDPFVLGAVLEHLNRISLERLRLCCLYRDMQDHTFCLLPHSLMKITNFSAQDDKANADFRLQASQSLTDCRSQKTDSSSLKEIVEVYSNSVDSIRSIISDHSKVAEKMEFVDAVIRQGGVYIASDEGVDAYLKAADVYILFASEEEKQPNRQTWRENSMAFLDLMKNDRNQKQLRQTKQQANNENLHAVFVYADCDFVSDAVANVREGIAIHHYVNGQCVCTDVAEETSLVASLNVARSCQVVESGHFRPPKRALVVLPCPGSNAHCSKSKLNWSCEVCRRQLEYGFDDNLYCLCGRALYSTFSFLPICTDLGNNFINFDEHVLNEYLQKLEPLREYNILLLGETGVGKSTFINGFANYVSYLTLDEAEKGDTVDPIPSSFTMTSENFKEVLISTGSDKNEENETGCSSTQMPKSYTFQRGDKSLVRIIDTPGIGDTRGVEYDKRNMQNIMTHIANLEEVNGICVLLKPNNARLTVMFEFCIKELLTHLHLDACKNIVFCFTNARGTFYRPGDTLPALRRLLSQKKNVNIELCGDTLYCIDNEPVRFLAALKNKVVFSEGEKANYRTSWETSVRETERLINYISSLRPHQLKNTLSLNEARRLIVSLSRPVAEITSSIQNNIVIVEQRRKEILESKKHKDELLKSLYIPAIDLEITPLEHPRTVCASPGCVEKLSIGGVQKIDYIKHCHPRCKISGAPTDTLNCVALKRCSAMHKKQAPHCCRRCGCPWEKHMHITYECKQVQKKVKDTNIAKQIREKSSSITIITNHLETLQQRIDNLESEKKPIAEITAKFAVFLQTNAIAPYNDSMADYLDHLISIERSREYTDGVNTTLSGLEQMRKMYDEEVKMLKAIIKDAVSDGTSLPAPEDVRKLVDQLYALPISGPMLKRAMHTAEDATTAAAEYSETRVQPKSRKGRIRKVLHNLLPWR